MSHASSFADIALVWIAMACASFAAPTAVPLAEPTSLDAYDRNVIAVAFDADDRTLLTVANERAKEHAPDPGPRPVEVCRWEVASGRSSNGGKLKSRSVDESPSTTANGCSLGTMTGTQGSPMRDSGT